MNDLEKERRAQTWLALVSSAIASVAGTFTFELDDDDESEESLEENANNIIDIACAIADVGLAEFDKRFTTGGNKSRARKRRQEEDDDDS